MFENWKSWFFPQSKSDWKRQITGVVILSLIAIPLYVAKRNGVI